MPAGVNQHSFRTPDAVSEYDPVLHSWVGEPPAEPFHALENTLLVGLGSLAALAALYAFTKGQQRPA